jgi:hypothetical protein
MVVLAAASVACARSAGNDDSLDRTARSADQALERAIRFYHSIAIDGGYVYYYSVDLSEKWGEGPTGDRTIEVQAPGTPAVGQAYLQAYRVTRNRFFLKAAMDAGMALVRGQNDLGGWGHVIHIDGPKSPHVSFDDDQTQGAIRFLMSLDLEVDDPDLSGAIDRALDMMVAAQMPSGGWPHRYPEQGNYHDFATFNDGGINDCIAVVMQAADQYNTPEMQACLRKAARFMELSQLPPPQSGWAQQYNDFLQPAWARSFEPPSVCTSVTLRNINTVLDMYLSLRDQHYLELLPDAFIWLETMRFPDGTWPRFVELHTGEPLYYDRGRIRVPHPDSLSLERHTGYGYIVDLASQLEQTWARYQAIVHLGAEAYTKQQNEELSEEQVLKQLMELQQEVMEIARDLDDQGRWIVKDDRYKKRERGKTWAGEYAVQDRLSSALFNHNVQRLCMYLELYKNYEKK